MDQKLEASKTAYRLPVRLIVVGENQRQHDNEGFSTASLRTLAASDPRVRLDLDFVADEDLQLYLRAADVVACPFLEIFTSGSVLLAMSFERAVIAPRRGCVVETVDESGAILYDADDPQGLGEALRVAMSADLAALGRHNGERVERFDWRRVAEATRTVYERAVGRPTS